MGFGGEILSSSSLLVKAPRPHDGQLCVSDAGKPGQGAVRQKEVGPLWSVSFAVKTTVHILGLHH